jgi:hypothetical protein
MARGTQFAALVYMLRAEIRRSTAVNVGVDDLPEIKQAINRQYAIQWAATEWPFLDDYYKLQLNIGQKLYSPPNGLYFTTRAMTFDRIKDIAVFYSGVPQRIERGIHFEDYALFDGDLGSYSDPVLKYDIRYGNAGQEQIEVWPVPSGSAQVLKAFAKVAWAPLVSDSDLCLIDDLLVVLFAAADLLSLDESEPRVGLPPAATLRLQLATAHRDVLRSNMNAGRRPIAIGQGHARPMVDTNSLVRVRG